MQQMIIDEDLAVGFHIRLTKLEIVQFGMKTFVQESRLFHFDISTTTISIYMSSKVELHASNV